MATYREVELQTPPAALPSNQKYQVRVRALESQSSEGENDRCSCCPYGYHIDLDFLNFCEDMSSGNTLKQLKKIKRNKKKLRKSMELILDQENGTASENFGDLPPDIVHSADASRLLNIVEYESSATRNILEEIDSSVNAKIKMAGKQYITSSSITKQSSSDGNDPRETVYAKFSTPPPKEVPATSSLGRADSVSSISSMSTVSSEPGYPMTNTVYEHSSQTASHHTKTISRTTTVTSSELAATIATHFPQQNGTSVANNSVNFDSQNSTMISKASLEVIREAMAVSLQRMRELEEQVKAIPVLQVRISVLKEEKRLLMLQLKAQNKKLNQRNITVNNNTISQNKTTTTTTTTEKTLTTTERANRTLDEITSRIRVQSPTQNEPMKVMPQTQFHTVQTVAVMKTPNIRSIGIGDHSVEAPYDIQPDLSSAYFSSKQEKHEDIHTETWEKETIILQPRISEISQDSHDSRLSQQLSTSLTDHVVPSSPVPVKSPKPITRTIGVGDSNVFDQTDSGLHIHEKELRTLIIGQPSTSVAKRNVGVECKVSTRDVGISYLCDHLKPSMRTVGIGTDDSSLSSTLNINFKSEEITTAIRQVLSKNVRSVGVSCHMHALGTEAGTQYRWQASTRNVGSGNYRVDDVPAEPKAPVRMSSVGCDVKPDMVHRSCLTNQGLTVEQGSLTDSLNVENKFTNTHRALCVSASTLTDRQKCATDACQTDVKVFLALEQICNRGCNTDIPNIQTVAVNTQRPTLSTSNYELDIFSIENITEKVEHYQSYSEKSFSGSSESSFSQSSKTSQSSDRLQFGDGTTIHHKKKGDFEGESIKSSSSQMSAPSMEYNTVKSSVAFECSGGQSGVTSSGGQGNIVKRRSMKTPNMMTSSSVNTTTYYQSEAPDFDTKINKSSTLDADRAAFLKNMAESAKQSMMGLTDCRTEDKTIIAGIQTKDANAIDDHSGRKEAILGPTADQLYQTSSREQQEISSSSSGGQETGSIVTERHLVTSSAPAKETVSSSFHGEQQAYSNEGQLIISGSSGEHSVLGSNTSKVQVTTDEAVNSSTTSTAENVCVSNEVQARGLVSSEKRKSRSSGSSASDSEVCFPQEYMISAQSVNVEQVESLRSEEKFKESQDEHVKTTEGDFSNAGKHILNSSSFASSTDGSVQTFADQTQKMHTTVHSSDVHSPDYRTGIASSGYTSSQIPHEELSHQKLVTSIRYVSQPVKSSTETIYRTPTSSQGSDSGESKTVEYSEKTVKTEVPLSETHRAADQMTVVEPMLSVTRTVSAIPEQTSTKVYSKKTVHSSSSGSPVVAEVIHSGGGSSTHQMLAQTPQLFSKESFHQMPESSQSSSRVYSKKTVYSSGGPVVTEVVHSGDTDPADWNLTSQPHETTSKDTESSHGDNVMYSKRTVYTTSSSGLPGEPKHFREEISMESPRQRSGINVSLSGGNSQNIETTDSDSVATSVSLSSSDQKLKELSSSAHFPDSTSSSRVCSGSMSSSVESHSSSGDSSKGAMSSSDSLKAELDKLAMDMYSNQQSDMLGLDTNKVVKEFSQTEGWDASNSNYTFRITETVTTSSTIGSEPDLSRGGGGAFENRHAVSYGNLSEPNLQLKSCIKRSSSEPGAKKEISFAESVQGGFELTEEMRKACEILHIYLEDSTRIQSKELNNCLDQIRLEWFKVSSHKLSNPHQVEDYLSSFNEIDKKLLKYIVNLLDSNGNCSIHYSVSHSNFEIVSLLLDTDVVDVDKQNKAGYSAIMLASLAYVQTDAHRDIVKRLFRMGDVNARSSQAQQTALMLSVSHGRGDMVKILMECDADINCQDEDGSTALMCACEHGHLDIVKTLIADPQCDVTLKDNDGQNALAIAMEAGHKDIGVILYAQMNFVKQPVSPGLYRKRRTSSDSSSSAASTPR
ncbi:uncharacterized protein LOC115213887 isoform X1 [Argonauta hians]